MNIVEHLFGQIDRSAPALIHRDRVVTFGELQDLTDRAASGLAATGLLTRPFTRVGLCCPNGLDHVLFSLAVLKAGGCLVPIPGELTSYERDDLIRSTAVNLALVAGGESWHRKAGEAHEVSSGELKADLLKGLLGAGQAGAPSFDEAALAALHPALIRFSSGTTGHSKGVVLSHQTLLDRVHACNARLRIGPGDRVIWVLPMAHHFAVSIILYLLHGATTVILDSHLGPDVLDGLRKHAGTVLYGSPFHHQLLAEAPGAAPLPHLRLAVSTAAALTSETARRFQEVFGLPLTQGFGIIECGLPLLNNEEAGTNPLALGRRQPAFDIRVAEPDASGVGELCLRGPGLFDAYLSPWQTRGEATDEDGYFHTGDLARLTEDGTVTLVGRLKAVINVAGMKVFAEEVESALNAHPAIAESRVSAQAHSLLGSVPVAEYVVAAGISPPSRAGLVKHCRARLANHKIPALFVPVDSLPKTASGKMRRWS